MPSISFPIAVRSPAIFNQRAHLFQIQNLKMSNHASGKRPFCPICSKPARLCLCSRVKHPPVDNSIGVTILQHSREKNHALNSTRVAKLGLKNLSVVTVSDVNFEARFEIRLMKVDACWNSDAIDSNNAFRSNQNSLESPNFDQKLDSINTWKKVIDLEKKSCDFDRNLESTETQEMVRKSVSETARLGNGNHQNFPENPNADRFSDWEETQKAGGQHISKSCYFDRNLESVETHEMVRKSGSETASFAARLENGSHQNFTEKPNAVQFSAFGRSHQDLEESQKAAGQSVSKTTNFEAEFDNGAGNCHTQLQCPRSHEQKLDSSVVSATPTKEENVPLRKNHLQLEKLDLASVLDCSAEMETLGGSDLKTNRIAANTENGFTNENSTQNSRMLDLEQASASETGTSDRSSIVSSKIHHNDQRRLQLSLISASPPVKEPTLDAENLLINPGFNPVEGCSTSNEAMITATIGKCGFTCSLTHLKTSQNGLEQPDFEQLASSSIGKDALLHGFIVKRLHRKLSGRCGGDSGGSMEFEEFEEYTVAVPPGSALLFPCRKSISLESVDFQVKHLIVLDGTWAKARRIYYENPWLKLLPHLKLDSDEVSLYREVRQQPQSGFLSTIESIICAMKALGEDNTGLDNLLAVFESMVRDQRRCKDERLNRKSLA